MFSALYRGNADPAKHKDLSLESEKLDASSCVVRFVDESDSRVNVSVTVECEVPTDDDRVREQLRRDLQQYHEFLLTHCAKDHCRPR
jgi:hypothetical protein